MEPIDPADFKPEQSIPGEDNNITKELLDKLPHTPEPAEEWSPRDEPGQA